MKTCRAGCVALLLLAVISSADAKPDANKVLRYAFEVAESSFDPHRNSDVYSGIVNNAIFEPPLRYDFLARPPKLIANTLVAMPEVSADYKTYTLHVKPGIFFSDDPAFGGKKRELTAEDYVYSIKRLFDPKLAAPLLAEVEGYIVGSEALMKRVRKSNQMDYDTPLEGLKALDRYTFQVKLNESKPNWIYNFADGRVASAVAREVVERYKDDIVSHPVGTGAYRLTSWKRSSRMVFESNPNYREAYFDGEPAADDIAGQAILARLKGKRLPMISHVEVSVIAEQQPRWISFLNREFDLLWLMPEDFGNMSVPNGKLAPNLQKAGIVMEQLAAMDLTYIYFNMEDATVGGYTPDRIALRRAISLGYKTRDEISTIRKNLAVPAHVPYAPGVAGYDPAFRTSANEHDPAKARALLDMYGYIDRNGDGYREMPDGSPLVLAFNSTPSDRDKQIDELLVRSMDDIGLKLTVRKAKWPDLLKESNAGKLMMWQLGQTASAPDALGSLQSLYGPNSGFKGNRARFKLAAFDAAFEKAEQLPHGPERTRLFQEMARIMVAYAPWKINTHRILTDMWYPYLIGFRRPQVQTQNWWRFVDIDLDMKKQFEAK
ncbi:MAG: ABC transporter substrate-binding protein [Betaproteobacteria bacterium]